MMDLSPDKAAQRGSSENKFSSTASTVEASDRMLSLLSQSQLRQQLECHVRYFLSGKLLNCTIHEGREPYECASVELGEEDEQGARKTLAFKATLSLVLLWLKAHGLFHTAGVLCPEADMRSSDVLSQEECQAVLQLPKALLKGSSTPCVSSGLQWNLLDSLIGAASQFGCTQTSSLPRSTDDTQTSSLPRSTDEVSAAERSSSSAGEDRCFQSDGGGRSPRRIDRTECTQRAKRSKGASCPPRSARKQKVESAASDPDSPACRNSGVHGSRWNDWQQMAQSKVLLLEAHLRNLELQESSKRLFAASEDSRQNFDQRIATLESEYEKRMRQLEKALDQATGSHGADARASALETQLTMNEARNKLEARLFRQKEMEERLAERETKLSERERRLDEKERELLRTALLIRKPDSHTEQNEANMMLSQENAIFRSQLSQARRQVKLLEAQLERQANECVNEGVHCKQPPHSIEMEDNEVIAASARPLSVGKPSIPHRGAGSEHAAATALKQEYEGRVARLTDEVQRSNDLLRNKDAEFKLLVVELESARRKNAEVQKRLKKMRKLYEAARATCVQHRKLASSMSLSLSCIDFAVEPPADLVDGEARDLFGGENVSPNACEPPCNAGSVPDLIKNGQPPFQEYATSRDDDRWRGWGDLDNGSPRKEVHEQSLCNATCDLQEQSFAERVRPEFQRCSIAAAERQLLTSSFRTLSVDLEKQPQPLSEASNAVNRTLTILTPPAGSGPAGTEASQPMSCSQISLDRRLPAFRPRSSDRVGGPNNSTLRGEQYKETVGPCRSSAPITLHETASKAPLLRESTSAGLEFHPVPLKQETSESLPKEITKESEQGATVDQFPEQQQAPKLDQCRQSMCSSLPKAESTSPLGSGLESEENENKEYSSTRQLQASPQNGEALDASNASRSGQDVAAPRSTVRGIPHAFPSKDPQTITVKRRPSVEGQLKPQGHAAGPVHEGPSTVRGNDSTLSATEAASRSPQENPKGCRETPVSTPRDCCGGEIACSSAVGQNIPLESSPPIMHRENEGFTGSRLQSPWAEASIASSLPESPQGLSNFPSLSCPVAATIEGIPSPTRPKLDCSGGRTAAQRKSTFAGSLPPSSSPSEHEWLACVSPTNPVIHTNQADSYNDT